MPNLEDYKPEKKFFALFAGDSGSGKSCAGASFEEPYHEIDTDQRFGGIAAGVRMGIIKNKKISYIQFDRLKGWIPVDKELQQLVVYKMQAAMNQITFPYKTIGLGSIGSLSRLLGVMARQELKGQTVGTLRLPAPGDIRVENTGVHTVLDYLKSMPCSVVCTAHIIDRWGKPPKLQEGDEYKPNVVIGEKLNLNDNLSSSILSEFDDVYRFERKIENNKEKYYVNFCTDFAKNSFGIPPGEFEWTDRNFIDVFSKLKELVGTGVKDYEKLKKGISS